MTKRKKTVRERYHTLVGANRWWQGDGLPTEMLRAVSDMKQQLIMMNEYGPYVLEVPIALRGRFQQNYSTFGTKTIHERLSETEGVRIEYVAGIKVPRLVPVCKDVVTGSDPDHPRCKCDPSPIGSRHELEVELIKKAAYIKELEEKLKRHLPTITFTPNVDHVLAEAAKIESQLRDEITALKHERDSLQSSFTALQTRYVRVAKERYDNGQSLRLANLEICRLKEQVKGHFLTEQTLKTEVWTAKDVEREEIARAIERLEYGNGSIEQIVRRIRSRGKPRDENGVLILDIQAPVYFAKCPSCNKVINGNTPVMWPKDAEVERIKAAYPFVYLKPEYPCCPHCGVPLAVRVTT